MPVARDERDARLLARRERQLVGDPEERIIRAYDVRWPIVGLTQRVTYVIGRNRKVRLAFHSELDMDAHSAQACRALAEQAASA